MCLTPEIMINPHANTGVTKYKKTWFTPQIASTDVSKMQNNQTIHAIPHRIFFPLNQVNNG